MSGNRSSGIIVSAVILGAALFTVSGLVANHRRDAPLQPIDFNHELHVTGNGIGCLYCHSDAVRADSAGVPPVETCYQCHRIVRMKTPEMEKVQQAYEERQPIPWLRIYSVPNHVRFSHRWHVEAGVGCQSCHGDVAAMRRITLAAPLTMGWCMDCHEQRRAPTGCEICHK